MSYLRVLTDAHRAREARIQAAAKFVRPKPKPVVKIIEITEKGIQKPLADRLMMNPMRRWADRQRERFPVVPIQLPCEKDPPCARRVRIWSDSKNIFDLVCKTYNVTPDEIYSRSKATRFTTPRQVLMYLLRTMTRLSMEEIAGRIGGRDHTTVLHGVRKISFLLTIDPELRAKIEGIKAQLT